MALFGIPNPTKKVTIDFSIEQVKSAIKRVPAATEEKYKLTSVNEAFNQITLEAFEFLSVGVYIDFNLVSVSDNRTEISIEIRRKIGSFDQSYEVTNANKHIENLVNILSQVITLSDAEFSSKYAKSIESIEKRKVESGKKWYDKNGSLITVCILSTILWILAPVALFGLYKRFSK